MKNVEEKSIWISDNNQDMKVIVVKVKNNIVFYKIYGNEPIESKTVFNHCINDFLKMYR